MIGSWKEGDTWGSGTCKSITVSIAIHRHQVMTDFGICITKFDGNISFQLILESNGGDSRDGSYGRRLSVCDMTNGTDVDLPISYASALRVC
jgi:hypothetical protein